MLPNDHENRGGLQNCLCATPQYRRNVMLIVLAAIILSQGGLFPYFGIAVAIIIVSALILYSLRHCRYHNPLISYQRVPMGHNGSDMAMGDTVALDINPDHLRLMAASRDFDANDYEELLRLDEGAGVHHGLHQSQIERFPRHMHTKEIKAKKLSCSICLETVQLGEEIRILPCLHKFHVTCIDKWLSDKPICPVCLFPVNQALSISGVQAESSHIEEKGDSI
mmetsp:Transcript_23769/g.38141  ORF Transcript_23769/g.38141 Transcript_23769/m.38141 type:complete len:223 (+) Transcript_23769:213-881(+)